MVGFDVPGFRKRQYCAELEQIDREMGRVGESFDRAAVFLADNPAAEMLHAEALALAARTKAFRRRCAALNEQGGRS